MKHAVQDASQDKGNDVSNDAAALHLFQLQKELEVSHVLLLNAGPLNGT